MLVSRVGLVGRDSVLNFDLRGVGSAVSKQRLSWSTSVSRIAETNLSGS